MYHSLQHTCIYNYVHGNKHKFSSFQVFKFIHVVLIMGAFINSHTIVPAATFQLYCIFLLPMFPGENINSVILDRHSGVFIAGMKTYMLKYSLFAWLFLGKFLLGDHLVLAVVFEVCFYRGSLLGFGVGIYLSLITWDCVNFSG